MFTGKEMFHPSPLRYPGGKGKIVNYLKLLLNHNNLIGCTYVEPYAGGAGAALALLYDEYVSEIRINDVDPGVFAFWSSILEETDQFCQLISDTPVTIETWQSQRQRLKRGEGDRLELGFATFFLNRTNRSGIINGGVIGGKAQSGNWKLDARYNKRRLIERIEKVARYKDKIEVSNMDAHVWICMSAYGNGSTFVYLDPPYYAKGSKLYTNYYEHEDHKAIADAVKRLPHYWATSYDLVPQILELYHGIPFVTYGLHYSAANRYTGSEIMFFSSRLNVPAVGNISSIGAKHLRLWEERLQLS